MQWVALPYFAKMLPHVSGPGFSGTCECLLTEEAHLRLTTKMPGNAHRFLAVR
jgi:hypothetical protein